MNGYVELQGEMINRMREAIKRNQHLYTTATENYLVDIEKITKQVIQEEGRSVAYGVLENQLTTNIAAIILALYGKEMYKDFLRTVYEKAKEAAHDN